MSDQKNKLYYGDNLQVLREYIADASVDLIKDTWEWNEEAARSYEEVIEQGRRVADA